jgi:predicted permease
VNFIPTFRRFSRQTEVMVQDLRFTFRTLARAPMFALVAILSLALGIGANSAIFSLLDQVLFRLLPIRNPERVVVFQFEGRMGATSSSDSDASVFSYPMYRDLRDRSAVFDGVIARSSAAVNIITNDQAEQASVDIVSGNFFDVLGVRPAIGRLFSAEDDITPGGHPAIVLSNGYWTRKFGASAAILNRSIRVNGLSMTVIGVTPRKFLGLVGAHSPDFYAPIAMKAQLTPGLDNLTDRQWLWLSIFGRLKPGVSPAQATAAMAPLFRGLMEEELARRSNLPERVRERFLANRLDIREAAQGASQLRRSWQNPLLVVMAMAGLVLLIACANVASLLIYRAAARWREITIRRAIGASRWALARQLLIESVTLSSAGGLAGLLLSYWIEKALISLARVPGEWVRPEIDGRVLAFTFAVSVLTGLLFGLAPTFSMSGGDVAPGFRDQGASLAKVRLRSVLLAAQMALSLVLLIMAGLFVRSLVNLLRNDLGFRSEGLLVFSINPALGGYKGSSAVALLDRLQGRIATLPGVVSVGSAAYAPLSNSSNSSSLSVEGYRAPEEENTHSRSNVISPAYFSTLGVPLQAGREFTRADDGRAQKVAIVNEAFVQRYVKGRNPIGLHMAPSTGNPKLDIEIVGVVRNSIHASINEKIEPYFYLPYMQVPGRGRMTVFVRASSESAALPGGVRGAVREIDSQIPVLNERGMTAQVEESVYMERMIATLATAFGALATLLATVGLHGVMSYMIARRTAEIGIRIALGATPARVIALVMRYAALLALAGLAAGVPCALAAGRVIEAQLFGVKSWDGYVMVGATVALMAAALVAAYLPARRAASIDPLRALRAE